MKLDLPAINKLTPPGLYALADLRAFVLVLVRVIELGIGTARDVKLYAHMLAQHTKELRTKTHTNLNLKIKTWVLACPERIVLVRSVIGEAAIRSWVSRLRAAYMSPRLMADKRQKYPDTNHTRKYKPRKYKPFALVRLSEVEKLLLFRPRWLCKVRPVFAPVFSGETGNVRHTARLARAEHIGRSQHSEPPHFHTRDQRPVRFFPAELGIKIREPKTESPAQKYGEDPPPQSPDKPDPNGSGPNGSGPNGSGPNGSGNGDTHSQSPSKKPP